MKKVTDLKENECIHYRIKKEVKAILKLNPSNDAKVNSWDFYKENTVYCPFYDVGTHGNLGYAYINKNKIYPASYFLEPTYQLTKSQIIAIAENGSFIKELFPDCFEVELEVGKWYKGFSFEGSSFLGVYGKKESADIIYGFWNGKWCDNKNGLIFSKYAKSFEPASEEEVTEALINEAKRRGFDGCERLVWEIDGIRFSISHPELSSFNYEKNNNNVLIFAGGVVFSNGKWAEIIKTPTEVIKIIETYGKDKLITLIEAYERNSK